MLFDNDHKGYITLDSFFNTLKEIQSDLTYSEIQKLFENLDSPKSGKIDLKEFVSFMDSIQDLS